METTREPEFLTIDELAALMRVPKFWIYMRTRKGQEGIPHLKFGRHLRFKKEEVIDFFKDEKNRFQKTH